MRLISDREGEVASSLVNNVLQVGHASIGDLACEYGVTSAAEKKDGVENAEEKAKKVGRDTGVEGEVNGNIEDDDLDFIPHDEPHERETATTLSTSEFHALVRKLLKEGYLTKVGRRTYLPEADLADEITETVIQQEFPDRKITGPKKAPIYKRAYNKLKRKYEEEDNYHDGEASHGVIKRAKPNGVPMNGDHDSGTAFVKDDSSLRKLPV